MIKIKTIFSSIILSIITIYILIFTNDYRYNLLWILPLCLTIIFFIFDITLKSKVYEIGFKSIKTVMTVKYCVTPLMIVLTNYYSGPGPEPSAQNLRLAILIMIYELIIVSTVILILFINKKGNKFIVKESVESESSAVYWVFLIVIFILISLNNMNFLIPSNYIFIRNNFTEIDLSIEKVGVLSILRNIFRVILPIALLNLIKNNKLKNKNKVVLSIFTYFIVITLYTSTSRWDVLIISLIFITLLSKIYIRYKSFIKRIIFSILCISLASISIYKFLGHTTTINSDIINSFFTTTSLVSKQFQVYFSGPRNVALAIEMNDSIDSNFFLLINDFLGSLPKLSKYFNQEVRLNLLFNNYIYNGNVISQIIPMIGIGYITLGFILSPILTVFFIIIIIYLNGIYYKKSTISDKYIILYMIFYTSMCFGMNIQILTNKYFATFIPTVLSIILCQKILKLLLINKSKKLHFN